MPVQHAKNISVVFNEKREWVEFTISVPSYEKGDTNYDYLIFLHLKPLEEINGIYDRRLKVNSVNRYTIPLLRNI